MTVFRTATLRIFFFAIFAGAKEFQRLKKSAICEHFITFNHRIDWNPTTMSLTEKDYLKRLSGKS